MRYYYTKQRYLESFKYGEESGNSSIDRVHEHIEDRVELSDTAKFKREMLTSLKEYTNLKKDLKNLNIDDTEEQN